MTTINRYVLVDRDDNEGDHEYERYDEAEDQAAQLGHAVMNRSYVYEDAELVFTPDGGDTWPPTAERWELASPEPAQRKESQTP